MSIDKAELRALAEHAKNAPGGGDMLLLEPDLVLALLDEAHVERQSFEEQVCMMEELDDRLRRLADRFEKQEASEGADGVSCAKQLRALLDERR